MKNIREEIDVPKNQAIKKCCSALREKYTNETSSFFCLYCWSEKKQDQCNICRTDEYLVPFAGEMMEIVEGCSNRVEGLNILIRNELKKK